MVPSIRRDPNPTTSPGKLQSHHLREHPVYLIELNDPRVANWVLLPILRDDGWTIGYRVVGERSADGVIPWVSSDVWATIKDDVVMP